MCDFISWIELDGVNYFLTSKQLKSKRGKELRDYLGSKYSEDVMGHGAIDYFYDLKGNGKHKECINFRDPSNFPNEIVELIKSGGFKGIGVCKEILTYEAYEKYQEIQQSACKEYQEIEQLAWEKYLEITQSAYEKYLEIEQPANKEYQEIVQPAWKKYNEIQQPAWKKYLEIEQSINKEYQEIRQSAYKKYMEFINNEFWKLATIKENRQNIWK